MSAPAIVRSAGDRDAWPISAGEHPESIAVEPVFALTSLVMVQDAVRAGVGAARLPLSLVMHDLTAGTLVRWGDVDGPDIALWTLYPSRRLLSARVSAFLDYLKQSFPKGSPEELAAYID